MEQVCCYCRNYQHTQEGILISGHKIVKCSACGLVIFSPPASAKELTRYYNSYPKRYPNKLWHYRQIRWGKRLKQLEKFLPNKGKILDIGTATGDFLVAATSHGWKATGVDRSPTKMPGIEILTKKIENLDLPKKSFNAITMWDVLEHLANPVDSLRSTCEILKPGGVLAISTINYNCLNRRLFGNRWRYFLYPEHTFYFTWEFLEDLFREMELEVILKRTVFSPQAFLQGFQGSQDLTSGPAESAVLVRAKDIIAGLTSPLLDTVCGGDLFEIYLRKVKMINKWGKFWDGMAATKSALTQVNRDNESVIQDLARIKERLHLGKDPTVLDFACGNGIITGEIAKFGVKVYGLDPSKQQTSQARQNTKKLQIRPTFITGDFRSLNKWKNKFDGIYCLTSFHYFRSLSYTHQVIESLLASSKPAGRIYISDIPSKKSRWYFLWKFLHNPNSGQEISPAILHPTDSYSKKFWRRLSFLNRRFGWSKVESDDWLWYQPEFFLSLRSRPDVVNVEIFPSLSRNKIWNYRFDVVITKRS